MTWVKNPCAFCNLHKIHMSVKMVKKKDCVKKQCWHLRKISKHPHWKNQKSSIKQSNKKIKL